MTFKIIKIYFRNGTAPHTYKVGVGPCGRNVIGLEHDIDRGHHHIEQWCEDNDKPDTFIYPQDTVARVVTYSTDTPWLNQEGN